MMGQGSWQEANLDLRRRRDEMDAQKFLDNARIQIGRSAVVSAVEDYLNDLRCRGAIYDMPLIVVDASPADVARSAADPFPG